MSYADFGNSFLRSVMTFADLAERKKDREETKRFRDMQFEQMQSDAAERKSLRTDLQAAARSQVPIDTNIVETDGNRYAAKDASQASKLAEMAQAEAEMRDAPAPVVKQGVQAGGNRIFNNADEAVKAGLGNDSPTQALARQAAVYGKYGQTKDQIELMREVERQRSEGAQEGLKAAIAGDTQRAQELYNMQGKDRISDLRVVREEGKTNQFGAPLIRIYGKVNGAEQETDMLRGSDAVTAYMYLQKDGAEKMFSMQQGVKADSRAEKVANSTIAAQTAATAEAGLNGQSNRKINDLRGKAIVADMGNDNRRLNLAENPMAAKVADMEKVAGRKFTQQEREQYLGIGDRPEKRKEFFEKVILEGVKAGTLKEADAGNALVKLEGQFNAAALWSKQEPQVREILHDAATDGKLAETVGEIKKKFPGITDDWFKANGYDPKNVDLKSFKSSAWMPIEAKVAKDVGIDPKYLSTIRLRGEKSNGDQVSPKGATSVYQIMPENAKAYGEANGLDITKPADAAKVSAMLIKERVAKFTKEGLTGDKLYEAVYRSYHGGYDAKGYGPVNKAYVERTMAGSRGLESVKNSGPSSRDLMAKAEPFEAAEIEARNAVAAADEELSRFGARQAARDREGFEAAKKQKALAVAALQQAQQRTRSALGGQ